MSLPLKPGERRSIRFPDGSGTFRQLPSHDLAAGGEVTVTAQESAVTVIVQPGQPIPNAPHVTLARGTHNPITLVDKTIEIVFAYGANLKDDLRGIEVTRGAVIIRDPDISGCGTGIRFFGPGTHQVHGGVLANNTRMVRNDATPTNNDYGAMGIAFDDVTSGSVLVKGVRLTGNRVSAAVPSFDYGLNEGSAFELWRSKGITIEDCWLEDNQVAVETGTNDQAKQCGLTFRRNVVRNAKIDPNRLSKGLLLRTATNSLIEHNVFDGMDHWAMTVMGGGGFGGSVAGLNIRDNYAKTPGALIQVSSPSGAWSHDYNAVGGTKAWGTGGSESHGITVTDPKLDATYHPLTGSPLIGKGHDGSNIGLP